MSLDDALRRLRPEWFRLPGSGRQAAEPAIVSVYVDLVYAGGVDALRLVPVPAVRGVRYLTPSAARDRFGTGCPCAGGVILVSTVDDAGLDGGSCCMVIDATTRAKRLVGLVSALDRRRVSIRCRAFTDVVSWDDVVVARLGGQLSQSSKRAEVRSGSWPAPPRRRAPVAASAWFRFIVASR